MKRGTTAQSVPSLVSAVAACAAGVVAVRAYLAAKEVADGAREQTAIARAEAAMTKQHYEERREARAREDYARFKVACAREDASRPRWAPQYRVIQPNDEKSAIVIRNTGKTSALKVECTYEGQTLAFRDVVDSGSSIAIHRPALGSLPETFDLSFDTVFGSYWRMVFTRSGDGWEGSVEDVERSYDIGRHTWDPF